MKPLRLLLPTPVSYQQHNLILIFFTGKNIRKLFKDGLIMRRQVHMHSTSRVKRFHEAKRKGKISQTPCHYFATGFRFLK